MISYCARISILILSKYTNNKKIKFYLLKCTHKTLAVFRIRVFRDYQSPC